MKNCKRMKKGFTLMETLLAVALVGLLVSIFLTVFVPSRRMVQEALTKQDAERVASVLRAEMATIRKDEQSAYPTAFAKGFDWLQRTRDPRSTIVIFSYRADTTKPVSADGTFKALRVDQESKGATKLVTIACPIDDPVHKDDLQEAVGPAFLVKMTQLRDNGKGELVAVSDPGTIVGGSNPDSYFSKDSGNSKGKGGQAYGGVIFYRADFYLMYPPNPERFRNRTWKSMGRPVFSSNLSFTR